MLTDFDRKKPFIDYLKKNTTMLEIDVNNHQILTEDLLIGKIQPYTSYVEIDADIDIDKS